MKFARGLKGTRSFGVCSLLKSFLSDSFIVLFIGSVSNRADSLCVVGSYVRESRVENCLTVFVAGSVKNFKQQVNCVFGR